MANVFGNPITDATLKAMAEYAGNANITSLDRARVALNMQTATMKDTNGRTYVEHLKQQSGNGVATLCLLYNATGNTLTFSTIKDWYGHIGQAPYPQRIQNGQWGAFLHVKSSGEASGSCSAVVFSGKDGNGADCEYMMAWSNPWNRTTYDNSVWIEVQRTTHFSNPNTKAWDIIYNTYLSVTRYNYRDTAIGCFSTIATGSDTSPVVEAIFTLEDAAK